MLLCGCILNLDLYFEFLCVFQICICIIHLYFLPCQRELAFFENISQCCYVSVFCICICILFSPHQAQYQNKMALFDNISQCYFISVLCICICILFSPQQAQLEIKIGLLSSAFLSSDGQNKGILNKQGCLARPQR